METEKSKEKQGGKEQRKASGRRRTMVHRACVVDCRALVWPRALSCPSTNGVVCDPQGQGRPRIPEAAGGPGLPLLGFSCLLLQCAEPCSNHSCPGCPAASLLPNTVHSGGWQKSPSAFAAQLPRRDGSNCLGLELPCKAKDLSKPWGSIRGGERRNRKDRENFLWLFMHCAQRKVRMNTWHLSVNLPETLVITTVHLPAPIPGVTRNFSFGLAVWELSPASVGSTCKRGEISSFLFLQPPSTCANPGCPARPEDKPLPNLSCSRFTSAC